MAGLDKNAMGTPSVMLVLQKQGNNGILQCAH